MKMEGMKKKGSGNYLANVHEKIKVTDSWISSLINKFVSLG